MTLPQLANPAARRLFLHAHALAEPPVGPASGADLAALIDRLGFVQIDSINTVARAHHMILHSRRQSYRPEHLTPLLERGRSLFEHWTHDAAILPTRHFGHWRHRFSRDAVRLHANWRAWFRPGYEAQFDTILRRIADHGAVTASEVRGGEVKGGEGGWWDWHPSKTALEWLWRTGALMITRRDGFQKVYDLTERVIPDAARWAAPDLATTVDWACDAALDRLGFATPTEIAAFWRAVTPAEAQDWCRVAKAQGGLIEIAVAGADGALRRCLARPDVLAAAAAAPEPPARLRILSPFDPVLRDRARAERLFGFHYRIEVFVPEARRRYGYYVFPVLEGARLIGRADVKAWRDEGVLRLSAFWPEPGVTLGPGRVARLEAELDRLARFAGCARAVLMPGWRREAGDLADP